MTGRTAASFVVCAFMSLGLLAFCQDSQTGASRLRVEALQIEGRVDPLGIEEEHPSLRWHLKAASPGDRGLRQLAYQVVAASSLERLRNHQGDVWDSGKTTSRRLPGATYEGVRLASGTTCYWSVRVWDNDDRPSEWSGPARWTTGLRPGDWKAKWIAAAPDRKVPRTVEGTESTLDDPAELPIFRHSFVLEKAIKDATAFVSGLGQYELRINGKPVTSAVLTPGWTDYKKTVPYNSYNVTAQLQQGKNAFAVLLGNGMYNVEGVKGRYTKFVGTYGQPKLILQMRVRFTDGTETIVTSDGSWKRHASPITFSSTYGGEDYDARLEPAGWESPEFEDKSWQNALEVQGPGGELHADLSPPIQIFQTFQGKKISEVRPGVMVYDLGQNFAGWPVLHVRGAKGAKITLMAGELLTPEGLVTQKSANAGPADPNLFSYTLRGDGVETWRPRFSYYGFRYVQVEGARGTSDKSTTLPVLEGLEGEFLHANAPVVGQFASSDSLLDRIHVLIDNSILSNMVSVPTDCPHREKLGWLEQTHLAGSSIMYNYDVQQLYDKMAHDMSDAQLGDGLVPSIAPEYVAFVDKGGKSTFFRDSPEWGSAIILSPWTAYQFYGDIGVLQQAYPAMQRYAAYLNSKAEDHVLSYGLGDWYDIGPKAPGVSQLTGKGLTATAIYYQDLLTLEEVAQELGKQSDSRRYAAEAQQVKQAFNAKLFHPETNEYDEASQTANAMPLVLGLVPEGHRERVLENLVRDIRRRENHVSAGDVGFHYVVRALTDGGRSDVLYDMLSRTDSPSYGYQLEKGATTLTEAWDTNPSSSQNHFMLGHAEEWFYRGLAGIRVDFSQSEAERIRIEPAFVRGLNSASAGYDSALGPIISQWKREGGSVELTVEIPAGANATIVLPTKDAAEVTEGAMPLQQSKDATDVRVSEAKVRFVVGSGHYTFRILE